MILGIIQARMRSTRLPGKVLLPLEGKPVLWHVFFRLTKSKLIDEVCISKEVKLYLEVLLIAFVLE